MGTADFALDPIPVPREADLQALVFPVGPVGLTGLRDPFVERVLAEIFDAPDLSPATESCPTVLRLATLPGAPAEAFEVTILHENDGLEIVLAGADSTGLLWAAETLRQLVCVKDGIRYVRLGAIRDEPGFALRGNKRPRAFESRYRANLSWENDLRPPRPERETVPVISPGGVLDATPGGLTPVGEFFDRGLAKGARRFAIEFDDVGYDLTPETRDLYGTYPFALAAFLRESRAMLRARDADAVLYWLPQTYRTSSAKLEPLARSLGLAGGLPDDLGLVLTGPEIISETIRATDIARARSAFGLTARKAVIYDNLGREGDHGPLLGRGPDLLAEVDGIFGERGEVLNRITRLDYSWNPVAYDPGRSHLLACREVVGPAAAPALHRLVTHVGELTPGEAAALLTKIEDLTDPDWNGPVDSGAFLRDIRKWLSEVLIVDSQSQTP